MSKPTDKIKKQLTDEEVLKVTNELCNKLQAGIDEKLRQNINALELFIKLEQYNREIIKLSDSITAKFPEGSHLHIPKEQENPLRKGWQRSVDLKLYVEKAQHRLWDKFNRELEQKINGFQEKLKSILQKKEDLTSTVFDFQLSTLLAEIGEFKKKLDWDKSKSTFFWQTFQRAETDLDKISADIKKQKPPRAAASEFHISDAATATTAPRHEKPLETTHKKVFKQDYAAQVKAKLQNQPLGSAAIVLENRKLEDGQTIPVFMVYVKRSDIANTGDAKTPYDLVPAMQFVYHKDKDKQWCINTPDEALLAYAKANKINTRYLPQDVDGLIAYVKNMDIRPIDVDKPENKASLSLDLPATVSEKKPMQPK